METTTVKLHPRQYDAYNFTRQFCAAIAGKQGGKTFVGSLWAGKKIGEFPKGVGIIAAPTYKILEQSTLEKFFTQFPELKKYHKQQRGLIELPTGGKVYIRSMDDPLGAEGTTANWIWADEAGQMPRLAWNVMRGRVSTTGGQIFMTTTWYELGWLYNEVFIPWQQNLDNQFEVYQWRSIDNPYFPKEFYEAEKRRLRSEEFARIYDAIPTKMEGLVWDIPPEQIIKPNARFEALLSNPDRVYGGVDWGFTNPAAIMIGKVKDGKVYLIDEWKEAGKTTSEIIEQCKLFDSQYGVNKWFPDPAEPDRIKEMQNAHLRIGIIKKNVPVNIGKVTDRIREKTLFVTTDCNYFLDEANQYHYEDGDTKKENPVKINDHLCDAVQYLITGMETENPAFDKVYKKVVFRDKMADIWKNDPR